MSEVAKMATRIRRRGKWWCSCRYCRTPLAARYARTVDRRRARDEIREQVVR